MCAQMRSRAHGLRGKPLLGSQVALARANKQEQFLVMWVGEENTSGGRQIGVSAVGSASSFWNDVVGVESQAGAGSEGNYPAKAPAKLKAKAHRA
jgi:hypothetical protein